MPVRSYLHRASRITRNRWKRSAASCSGSGTSCRIPSRRSSVGSSDGPTGSSRRCGACASTSSASSSGSRPRKRPTRSWIRCSRRPSYPPSGRPSLRWSDARCFEPSPTWASTGNGLPVVATAYGLTYPKELERLMCDRLRRPGAGNRRGASRRHQGARRRDAGHRGLVRARMAAGHASPSSPDPMSSRQRTGEPLRPSSSSGRSLGVGRPLQLERVQEVQVAR
jgi:hypothetical protein